MELTEKNQIRAIAYRRVSTDEQVASGAGLDAQAARIAATVEGRGWVLTETVTEVDGVSGGLAPGERPGLSTVLTELDAGRADVLVVAKLDRLSRSVVDLLGLLERADRSGWRVVILDADIDTTSASGRLVATLLGAVAEWERSIIRERTRDALATRKAAGVRLGGPVVCPPAVRRRVAELSASGLGLSATARVLTAENVPTAKGGRWWPSTVAAVLKSLDLDAYASQRREGHPVGAVR